MLGEAGGLVGVQVNHPSRFWVALKREQARHFKESDGV
jgi:hypothetical protein